jgi:hypothetical protein
MTAPLSPDNDLEKLCLDFNGYTIFPAKIEHKTIAGKKLADGFKLYHPDGELIQDIFSASGAVSLFAKVVFDEINPRLLSSGGVHPSAKMHRKIWAGHGFKIHLKILRPALRCSIPRLAR